MCFGNVHHIVQVWLYSITIDEKQCKIVGAFLNFQTKYYEIRKWPRNGREGKCCIEENIDTGTTE